MIRSTLAVVAAAFVMTPAALAEGQREVTLKHQYDAALLASDEGASLLLAKLERAAKRTCTSRAPASGGEFTDKACAEALYAAAIKQIYATERTQGAAIAPAFEREALTQLASAE
jgi:UrcA family protein